MQVTVSAPSQCCISPLPRTLSKPRLSQPRIQLSTSNVRSWIVQNEANAARTDVDSLLLHFLALANEASMNMRLLGWDYDDDG